MRSFRVGSAFGVPVQVDLTFLLVLPAFAYLIGSEAERIAVELLNGLWAAGVDPAAVTAGSVEWALGFLAAAGLFAGVLCHEFGHALVAMRYGYDVESITLWVFGGMASLAETPEDWRHELAIAVAGPAVSVLVGAACYAGFRALPPAWFGARFVVGYLALLNVGLAAFNMLPGFPMDGGRVLRALLARRRGYVWATELAAEVGKAVALVLALVGLFSNVLLVGLAAFVYLAAAGEARSTSVRAALEGVTVADVMTPMRDADPVAPGTTVAEAHRRMIRRHETGLPVLEGGRVAGVVTLGDVRTVPEVEREAVTVGDVARPVPEPVAPDDEATTALTRLRRETAGRLPVVGADGHPVGVVSRTDLRTAFDVVRSSRAFDARTDAGPLADVPDGRRDHDRDPDDPEVRR